MSFSSQGARSGWSNSCGPAQSLRPGFVPKPARICSSTLQTCGLMWLPAKNKRTFKGPRDGGQASGGPGLHGRPISQSHGWRECSANWRPCEREGKGRWIRRQARRFAGRDDQSRRSAEASSAGAAPQAEPDRSAKEDWEEALAKRLRMGVGGLGVWMRLEALAGRWRMGIGSRLLDAP